MIQAIIFDIGGVLLRTHDQTYRRTWEAKLGLQPGDAERIVLNSEMGKKAQLGQITTDEKWEWIGGYFGLSPLEWEQFRHDFWAGDLLDHQLVDLIRQLHTVYQTAVLSNYSDILYDQLVNEFGLGDDFDTFVISCEVGVMKPDRRIYEIVLEQLGRQPHEAVFIDDFAHNISGAQALGMHGIHFQPGIDLVAALAELGVQTPRSANKPVK